LEDIEAGSLRAWLRTALESVDDQAIKDLQWKRLVGSYLVRAKHTMVDFLSKRSSVGSKEEIYSLQERLLETAKETDVLRIPTYQPIPATKVANAVRLLGEAPSALQEGDAAKYVSTVGEAPFNLTFKVAPEYIEDLLTKENHSKHQLDDPEGQKA